MLEATVPNVPVLVFPSKMVRVCAVAFQVMVKALPPLNFSRPVPGARSVRGGKGPLTGRGRSGSTDPGGREADFERERRSLAGVRRVVAGFTGRLSVRVRVKQGRCKFRVSLRTDT
jgi:hypothetical protein